MRVLLADKLPDEARVRLATAGCEVRSEPKLGGAELGAVLASFDPHVLVVRSTQVGAEHVAAGRSLSLVVRAGAGVNTIDTRACAERGVYVSNTPGKNAVAVAELTLGLLVALDRRIPDNVADLRAGRWAKGEYGKARGLKGRTLGLIGVGGIGREVAVRALAFGMDVVGWSRSLTPAAADELGIQRAETPEEVARRSDAVSVHLALVPATRGLVGESIFAAMRSGTLFLNTSRAEIVDEGALRHAIETRGLRAGLDVFSGEPPGSEGVYEGGLGAHPGVYATHHIGASTDQAQQAVADEVCHVVETFLARGRVPNCVNLAERTAATHVIVIRHADRVGVLASVLDVLRRGGLNVEEMENTVFAGGHAAVARISVGAAPSSALVAEIDGQEHVFAVSVVALS